MGTHLGKSEKKEKQCITKDSTAPALWNALQALREQYDSLN